MDLDHIKSKYQDFLYERRVQLCVLEWVKKYTHDTNVIRFELNTIKSQYIVTSNSWTKISHPAHVKFFVYRPNNTEIVHELDTVLGEKIVLFSSDFLKIVEIYNTEDTRRIRHGISGAEKQYLLSECRKYVCDILTNKTPSFDAALLSTNKTLYTQIADVDVVMWVNGKVRGSIIKRGLPFNNAVISSALASLRDSRFKPIERSELNLLTIEINILSDLYIPIPQFSNHDYIDGHKGYFVTYNHKSGWYLPAVFNAQKYNDLPHLLYELAFKKASIENRNLNSEAFSMFEVCTFVEKTPNAMVSNITVESDMDKIISAADWLVRIQYTSGFMPTVISPYGYTKDKADWVRMALVAYALKLYGLTVHIEQYAMAANTTYAYIRDTIDTLALLPRNTYTLTIIYLCKVAILDNNLEELNKLFKKIETELVVSDFSIIAQLQLASFFLEMPHRETKFELMALNIIESQFDAWENLSSKMGNVLSYAEYAELIPLLYSLSAKNNTPKNNFHEKYKKIVSWYTDNQLPNGAFPNTTESSYTYTRGTGKIVEALAIDKENLEMALKGLQWVMGLQYTNDNLYNIHPTERDSFLGSLMHDHTDHSAWTDSVSHILIGAARLKNA